MFTSARIKATHGKGSDFYIKHLSNNDYYSEHNQIEGIWKGNLSKDFGLENKKVSGEAFSLFQQNINPKTNEKLTKRDVQNSVRFYDFQCSAQKSVSIMALFDERLVEAHRECVELGMTELERMAAVRVRQGDNFDSDNIDYTGKFVYAQYHHDNSRALDPQLHSHNVIVNVTADDKGEYKALQTREMCRAIRYAGKTYQNAMACECKRLGYDVELKYDDKGQVTGFEIKGIPEEILERCSKRRKQIDDAIEKFYREHGRQPNFKEINNLTLLTRDRKMIVSEPNKVLEYKLNLFSDSEKKNFHELVNRAHRRTGFNAVFINPDEAAKQIDKVAEQLFERNGIMQFDKLLAEVQNQNLGQTRLEELKKALDNSEKIRNLGGGNANPFYSTEDNIAREKYVFDSIDRQKDLFEKLKSQYVPFSEKKDNLDRSSQIQVINDILESKDRFMIFRGVAGAGKTSTLQELTKCLRSAGVGNIHVIAPTNSAVDVLRSEKFGSAQTVTSFLQDSLNQPPPGSYLIVDESGLNSLKQGADMVSLAQRNNYRILFVGDARQHKSVEAGDFFRLIEDHTEIKSTALTEIYRQQTKEYRDGISLIAAGKHELAYNLFDAKGYIYEGKGQYLSEAAKSFMKFTDDGKNPLDCLVVTPTLAEADKLTDEIRKCLKEAKVIDEKTERGVTSFRSFRWTKQQLSDSSNYKPGYKVFFTGNKKDAGKAGEMYEIQSVGSDYIHLSNGKMLHLPSVKQYIEVGESSSLPVAGGDVIRFTVNYKTDDFKISNGSQALATGRPNEYVLLDHNRQAKEKIVLPDNFAGFKHGWVTTSHGSQGMTTKNVVVAAEKMAKDAFYVSLSRGKFKMALHVPEKEHFRERLLNIKTERLSVADLVKNKTISRQATKQKEEHAKKYEPDTEFLNTKGRVEKQKIVLGTHIQAVRKNEKIVLPAKKKIGIAKRLRRVLNVSRRFIKGRIIGFGKKVDKTAFRSGGIDRT